MVKKFTSLFKINPTEKVYLFSILIGCSTAFVAIILTLILAQLENLFINNIIGVSLNYTDNEYHKSYPISFITSSSYFLLLVPSIGFFISNLISHQWAKETKGSGTEAIIKSFHQNEGRIRKRVPFVKTITTLLTLGTGGNAGKEGPMTQIGAGIGTLFSKMSKMGTRARRTFLLAGAAGGLGAIFKAPLGGALTAIEVLYKEDLETDSLVPCIISSTTAYIIYAQFFGYDRLFSVPYYSLGGFKHIYEVCLYVFLGFICVIFGALYVKSFNFIKDVFFDKLPIHNLVKPLIGGLLLGIIGLMYQESIGNGFGTIQRIFSGEYESSFLEFNAKDYFKTIKIFCLLIALRTLTMSLTIGSGGSGGIFVPSLVIGGLLGGTLGCFYKVFFPNLVSSITPYAIVGMGAFFAGVANAPIASMVMVCEITGAYQLLPPLMLVSIIAIIFSKKYSIYTNQLINRFSSPAHLWDMKIDLLKTVSIKDFLKDNIIEKVSFLNIVKANTSIKQMQKNTKKTHSYHFIIVNDNNKYLGGAFIGTNNKILNKSSIADDILNKSKRSVDIKDDLSMAIANMLYDNVDRIAVIENDQVISLLEYKSIMKFYQKQMKKYSKIKSN